MTITRKSHMPVTEIKHLHMTVTFREPVPLCRPNSPYRSGWKKAKKRPSCGECKRRMKDSAFMNPLVYGWSVYITFI
jgi:hypothetical protein